jgi:ATP-dependent Lon protease
MELTKEYHTLCLKNKLQTNLKYYLLGANKPYHLLGRVIEILKIKYNEPDTFNELERLRQNIHNYVFSLELLRVEDWIVNWKNKQLINELNNFVDTSRNYELEEQIKDLQKQLNEIKEINLQQNPYIERIDEKLA